MTNMFKKTLLASAVLAFAGAAQAATIVASEHEVTSQYLASTGDNHTTANDIVVTLGANYAINDVVRLTFSAPVVVASLPTQLEAAVVADAVVEAPIDLPGKSGVVLSLLGTNTENTIATYRVTSIDNTGVAVPTTVNVALDAIELQFAKANLSSGVTVSFSAETNSGLALDTAGGTARTASLVDVIAQFTKTAPSFARVVDVEQQRRRFVNAATAPATDYTVVGTFNIVSETTAGTTYARPITKVKHTVAGDFSWVRDTDTDTANIQFAGTTFAVDNCAGLANLAVTSTAVSFECTGVVNNTTLTIDPEENRTATHNPVLPTQTFSATSEVTYSGPVGTEKVFDAVSAGSWTLNGSSVHIPYMPYGEGINQIINLNNAGSQSGDITVEAIDRTGESYGPVVVATAEAGKQVALAQAIKDALVAEGMPATERASITLVTNVPAADVTVYSAYNVNGTGARLVVNNSNGK